MHWIDHILFFLFGIAFPWQAIFRTQPLLRSVKRWDTALKRSLYLSNSISLLVMAGIVLLAWWWLGRPWSELGFRWPLSGSWQPGLIGAAIFSVAYMLDVWLETRTPQALAKTKAHWRMHTPFMPDKKREVHLFYSVAFSAAVGEEIVFRGFFIFYFLQFFAASSFASWWAIGIPSVIFALAHYYQGWKSMLKIGLLSLIFGWLLVITKSLLIPIILHFLVDVAGGYLGPWLWKDEPAYPVFDEEE